MVVARDPFPHVWIENALPANLYAAAAALWPVTAARTKDRVNWTTPETGPWRDVADYCAETLAPLALDRFAEDIATHRTLLGAQAPYTPTLANQPLAGNGGRWMARKQGYRLKPHVDVAPFFVTVLHYFATTPSPKDGTRLYRAERPLPTSALGEARTQYFEDYGIPTTHVKTCPWVPNGCLLFPNRLDAAHGNIVLGSHWRYAYQWHLALPDAAASRVYQQSVMGLAV